MRPQFCRNASPVLVYNNWGHILAAVLGARAPSTVRPVPPHRAESIVMYLDCIRIAQKNFGWTVTYPVRDFRNPSPVLPNYVPSFGVKLRKNYISEGVGCIHQSGNVPQNQLSWYRFGWDTNRTRNSPQCRLGAEIHSKSELRPQF